jgi:cytochrome c556
MKRALIVGLAIAFTAGGALAYDAASQIKDRQAGMKQIGGNMKGLYDTLSGDKDPTKIKSYAANIDGLAKKRPSSGEKTKARAEVWTDPVGFKASAADFTAQAARLNAAAQSGDAEKVQAAFAATRGTCKSCHDKYQAK